MFNSTLNDGTDCRKISEPQPPQFNSCQSDDSLTRETRQNANVQIGPESSKSALLNDNIPVINRIRDPCLFQAPNQTSFPTNSEMATRKISANSSLISSDDSLLSILDEKLDELCELLRKAFKEIKNSRDSKCFFNKEILNSINQQSDNFTKKLNYDFLIRVEDRKRVRIKDARLTVPFFLFYSKDNPQIPKRSNFTIDFNIISDARFFPAKYARVMASFEKFILEMKSDSMKETFRSLLENFRMARDDRNRGDIIEQNYIEQFLNQFRKISCFRRCNISFTAMLILIDLIKEQLMVFFTEHIKLKVLFIPEIITLREVVQKKYAIYYSKRQENHLQMLYSLVKLNCFFTRLSKTNLNEFFTIPEDPLSRYTFALTILFLRENFMVGLFQSLGLNNSVIIKYIYFIRCESSFLLSIDGSNISDDKNRFNPLSLFFFGFFNIVKFRRPLTIKGIDLHEMNRVGCSLLGNRLSFATTCVSVNLKGIIENIENNPSPFEESQQYLGIQKRFQYESVYLNRLKSRIISEYRDSRRS